MHEPKPSLTATGYDDDEHGNASLAWLGEFFTELRQYLLFLIIVLPIFLILAGVYFLFGPRVYEATALVGPRGPSPTDTMLTSITGNPTAGLASRFLGSMQGGGNDPYQEYLQLVPSTRLAQVLIDKYHLDRQIFYKDWDNEKHEWKVGLFQDTRDAIKRIVGLPVTHGPTVDSLMKYFDNHLKVVGVSTGMSSLIGGSTYTEVDFKFDDPVQAQYILDTMLLAADQIIRGDQRRDVDARISTLKNEISKVTLSDERSSLIDVLTSQEQLLTMIQADHRYASNLIVPSYASPKPISPNIVICAIVAVLLSLFVWMGLVLLSLRFDRINSLMRRFRKKSRR